MNLIIYILLACFNYVFLFLKWRKTPKNLLLNTAFYGYLCIVLYLTLLPLPRVWDPETITELGNFIPFRDLKYGYDGALKDIILNVIMTVPLGIFFPTKTRTKWFLTVLFGLTFSLAIEGFQLAMTALGSHVHSFDVTDIISNTAGTAIGYLIYKILCSIKKDPE